MKPGMIVTASMLTTIAAVILLVALQSLHTRTWGGEKAEPVTASHQPVQLTNDNLVDVLRSLHMSTPIARVEWKQSILTIDLKVKGTDTTYTEIYESMAAVADLSFRGLENVEQVLLRVMAEDEWLHKRHLLLLQIFGGGVADVCYRHASHLEKRSVLGGIKRLVSSDADRTVEETV